MLGVWRTRWGHRLACFYLSQMLPPTRVIRNRTPPRWQTRSADASIASQLFQHGADRVLIAQPEPSADRTGTITAAAKAAATIGRSAGLDVRLVLAGGDPGLAAMGGFHRREAELAMGKSRAADHRTSRLSDRSSRAGPFRKTLVPGERFPRSGRGCDDAIRCGGTYGCGVLSNRPVAKAAAERRQDEALPDSGSSRPIRRRSTSVMRNAWSREAAGWDRKTASNYCETSPMRCRPVSRRVVWPLILAGSISSGKLGRRAKLWSPTCTLPAGSAVPPITCRGCRRAKHIVAINTDANAPIMKSAHLGLVADLYPVLEGLKQRLAR